MRESWHGIKQAAAQHGTPRGVGVTAGRKRHGARGEWACNSFVEQALQGTGDAGDSALVGRGKAHVGEPLLASVPWKRVQQVAPRTFRSPPLVPLRTVTVSEIMSGVSGVGHDSINCEASSISSGSSRRSYGSQRSSRLQAGKGDASSQRPAGKGDCAAYRDTINSQSRIQPGLDGASHNLPWSTGFEGMPSFGSVDVQLVESAALPLGMPCDSALSEQQVGNTMIEQHPALDHHEPLDKGMERKLQVHVGFSQPQTGFFPTPLPPIPPTPPTPVLDAKFGKDGDQTSPLVSTSLGGEGGGFAGSDDEKLEEICNFLMNWQADLEDRERRLEQRERDTAAIGTGLKQSGSEDAADGVQGQTIPQSHDHAALVAEALQAVERREEAVRLREESVDDREVRVAALERKLQRQVQTLEQQEREQDVLHTQNQEKIQEIYHQLNSAAPLTVPRSNSPAQQERCEASKKGSELSQELSIPSPGCESDAGRGDHEEVGKRMKALKDMLMDGERLAKFSRFIGHTALHTHRNVLLFCIDVEAFRFLIFLCPVNFLL